jgi:hypothetical protein
VLTTQIVATAALLVLWGFGWGAFAVRSKSAGAAVFLFILWLAVAGQVHLLFCTLVFGGHMAESGPGRSARGRDPALQLTHGNLWRLDRESLDAVVAWHVARSLPVEDVRRAGE